jgi:glycosyltransferase involved in cell wall biosynthesis
LCITRSTLPTALGRYRGIPRVVTVYDMIPELMRHTKRRLDFVTQKRRFLEKADHIICISESTKSDLLRVWPDLQAPISVTYLGASELFAPRGDRPASLPDRYILHVGTRSGYKDAWTLTEAFARVAPDHPDVTLVYVGGGAPTPDESQAVEFAGAARPSSVDVTKRRRTSCVSTRTRSAA